VFLRKKERTFPLLLSLLIT